MINKDNGKMRFRVYTPIIKIISSLEYQVFMKGYGFYIFDLDNTLLNSRPGHEEAFKTAFREFNIPYHPERYDEYISTPLSFTFSEYHPNSPCKYRDFLSIFTRAYNENYMKGVCLFPDAVRCLATLSKTDCKLGVVSNSYSSHIRDILSSLGVLSIFSSIVGCDNVMVPKPDPEPVLLCMREMGALTEGSVMIGDSRNDIIAAKSAGIDAILIDRSENRELNVDFDMRISSLDELLEV